MANYFNVKLWSKEIQARAEESGLVEVLLLARFYKIQAARQRMLQKPKNKLPQQPKTKHRVSKINDEIKEKIFVLKLYENLSSRDIAKRILLENNFSIHYSTICRILNFDYEPKPEKD